ncbi:MAG: hypothetical protein E7329_07440 [Clostridiales bacterium]|nr:hypothetical protein [Clostridiales bacterium]
MKTAAIVLIVLVLAVGGCLGYGLFNSTLQVTGKGLQTIPASERAGEFEALRNAMEQNSLLGTILNRQQLGTADGYSYYIYTLRLHNPGLVPAEMVEMQIAPIQQDVLFYGENQEIVIPPQGTRDVWCVLLTQGTPHPVRDLYITYYLWGHPHEVKFTYDNAY